MYSKETQRKGASRKTNLGKPNWILQKRSEKKAQKRDKKRMKMR